MPRARPLRELSDRLEREYGERVTRFARGFGLWGSSTFTAADVVSEENNRVVLSRPL